MTNFESDILRRLNEWQTSAPERARKEQERLAEQQAEQAKKYAEKQTRIASREASKQRVRKAGAQAVALLVQADIPTQPIWGFRPDRIRQDVKQGIVQVYDRFQTGEGWHIYTDMRAGGEHYGLRRDTGEIFTFMSQRETLQHPQNTTEVPKKYEKTRRVPRVIEGLIIPSYINNPEAGELIIDGEPFRRGVVSRLTGRDPYVQKKDKD